MSDNIEGNVMVPDGNGGVAAIPKSVIRNGMQAINTNGSIPNNGPRRAFFRSDSSAFAAKLSLFGETFFFRRVSDEKMNYIKEWQASVAREMGLQPEDYAQYKWVGVQDLQEIQERAQVELWTTIVTDALQSWTLTDPSSKLPIPLTTETIADLHLDILKQLSTFIIGFTRDGVGEAEFFS